MYKFRKIVSRSNFSGQFWKITIRYKRTGYNMNVMRQTACLVVYPVTVGKFAALFNCTPAGLASDLMKAPAENFQLSGLGVKLWNWSGPPGTVGLLLPQRFRVGLAVEYSSCFILVLNLDLYVCCFDWVMSRSPSRGPNNLCFYEPQHNLGRGLLQREIGVSPRPHQ